MLPIKRNNAEILLKSQRKVLKSTGDVKQCSISAEKVPSAIRTCLSTGRLGDQRVRQWTLVRRIFGQKQNANAFL